MTSSVFGPSPQSAFHLPKVSSRELVSEGRMSRKTSVASITTSMASGASSKSDDLSPERRIQRQARREGALALRKVTAALCAAAHRDGCEDPSTVVHEIQQIAADAMRRVRQVLPKLPQDESGLGAKDPCVSRLPHVQAPAPPSFKRLSLQVLAVVHPPSEPRRRVELWRSQEDLLGGYCGTPRVTTPVVGTRDESEEEKGVPSVDSLPFDSVSNRDHGYGTRRPFRIPPLGDASVISLPVGSVRGNGSQNDIDKKVFEALEYRDRYETQEEETAARALLMQRADESFTEAKRVTTEHERVRQSMIAEALKSRLNVEGMEQRLRCEVLNANPDVQRFHVKRLTQAHSTYVFSSNARGFDGPRVREGAFLRGIRLYTPQALEPSELLCAREEGRDRLMIEEDEQRTCLTMQKPGPSLTGIRESLSKEDKQALQIPRPSSA